MDALSADEPLIHPDCEIADTRFGGWCEVGRGARIVASTFGAYAYCDRYSDIANTAVGAFASIAAFTRIGPTDHTMAAAAQHHFVYRSSRYWDEATDDAAFFARRGARRTTLGPDVWVGHGAVIRPDVVVGAGAVVAAGAVVTRDVAPYAIVAGVPARLVRARFAPVVAARLLALAWWDWPHHRLRAALEDFRALSAEAFLERHGG